MRPAILPVFWYTRTWYTRTAVSLPAAKSAVFRFLLAPLAAACALLMTTVAAISAETNLDGHRIWYEVTGTGLPAIVLVHGWTCDSTFFAPQIPEFSKRHRVLAIDLPGHGRSDKPELTYDGELFARAVLAAMDAAGIDSAVLIGHSMGLPVIRHVYAKAPSRVLGLVSVDGRLSIDREPDSGKRYGGPDGLASRRKLAEYMFSEATPEALRREIAAKMLATPEHVAVSAMSHGVGSPLWSGPPVTAPTLAIQQKRANSPAVGKSFQAAFTNLDYREWEGVGHFLHMEKPAEFNAAVLAWMDAKVAAK